MTRRPWLLMCLLLSGCAAMCGDTIPPGTVGLLVDNMAGGNNPKAIEVKPGPDRVWVGPYHDLYQFPTSVQQHTWAGKDEYQFQTVDGSVVHADLGITFHVIRDDVLKVFTTYRQDLEHVRDVYIRNTIREALNEVTSHLDVNEAIGPKKDYIIGEVFKRTAERLRKDGITVDTLSLVGAFRPPQAVIDSLNAKLAATQKALEVQNQVAQAEAQARKDKAQAEGHAAAVIAEAEGAAKARALQAQAEADANRKISQSITPELVRYRQIEKWDGVLPQIQGGGGTSFLIDTRDTARPQQGAAK